MAGVVEHYLAYNLFVISDSYYKAVFDEPADESVFLLKGSIDGLYEAVKDLEGFWHHGKPDNQEFPVLRDVYALSEDPLGNLKGWG